MRHIHLTDTRTNTHTHTWHDTVSVRVETAFQRAHRHVTMPRSVAVSFYIPHQAKQRSAVSNLMESAAVWGLEAAVRILRERKQSFHLNRRVRFTGNEQLSGTTELSEVTNSLDVAKQSVQMCWCLENVFLFQYKDKRICIHTGCGHGGDCLDMDTAVTISVSEVKEWTKLRHLPGFHLWRRQSRQRPHFCTHAWCTRVSDLRPRRPNGGLDFPQITNFSVHSDDGPKIIFSVCFLNRYKWQFMWVICLRRQRGLCIEWSSSHDVVSPWGGIRGLVEYGSGCAHHIQLYI